MSDPEMVHDLQEVIRQMTVELLNDGRRIAELKEALRAAIKSTSRTTRRCIEYDPAGSTYEVDWSPDAKKWAALCDLDLDNIDPMPYER